MNMRFLPLMLAILASMAAPAGALLIAPNMDIVLTAQEPFPAEPGKNVEIEVEIQNNGQGAAEGVVVEIVAKEPFSLLPGEDASKSFSIIGAEDSVKATYRMHVDEEAVTDDYGVEFRVHLSDSVFLTEEVEVSVQGEPRLVLDRVGIEEENVEAGGTATLSIFVDNVGTGTARHLSLSLNASIELIPVLSEGSVYVGDVGSGGSGEARIRVSVGNTAEEKTYVMKLYADYLDESGDDQQKEYSIGIPVTGTIKLDVIRTEARPERGLFEIEVANKGTSEAKSVEAKLFAGDELVDIDYTSQIKPNKKTTFSFPLVSSGSGRLEISYIGPGLASSAMVRDIVFDYKANGNGSGGAEIIAATAVLIVAVGGYWFWRRRKGKGKK